jgi:hypothetical protein
MNGSCSEHKNGKKGILEKTGNNIVRHFYLKFKITGEFYGTKTTIDLSGGSLVLMEKKKQCWFVKLWGHNSE